MTETTDIIKTLQGYCKDAAERKAKEQIELDKKLVEKVISIMTIVAQTGYYFYTQFASSYPNDYINLQNVNKNVADELAKIGFEVIWNSSGSYVTDIAIPRNY